MKYLSKYSIIFMIIVNFLVPFQLYSQDTTLTNVKLQLKWKHQFQFAGYYAAIEQGFYKDVGLQVELIEATEGELPIESLFNNKSDFAISSPSVILLRSLGKPIVVLATIFQHSPVVILTTKKSKIKNIHDLYGKKIMIEDYTEDILAYFNDESIELDSMIVLEHTFNIESLISGKIDAMTAYSTDEPFLLEKEKIPYNILSPLSSGIDFYGDLIVTTEQMISENPEIVENFREASLKGWDYAMKNPDTIINLIFVKYSDRHSIDHLKFEANAMKKLINQNIIEIGYSNPKRWQRIIEIYEQTGKIEKGANLSGLFYSEYLKKKINIPWKLIGIFTLLLLLSIGIILYFFSISRKLKNEIKQRKIIQHKLFESKKLEQLGYVVRGISHEISSPIATCKLDISSDLYDIENIIDDIKNKSVNNSTIELLADVKNRHNRIYRNLEYAGDLLESYHNIAKDELKGEKRFFNIKDKVNDIIVSIYPRIEHIDKKINIKTNFKGIKTEIYSYPNAISQILLNLLINSIKHGFKNIDKGSIYIDIETDDKNILINYSDSGVGIPEKNISHIFDMFFTTSPSSSSGLGLSIIKRIIEDIDGKISCSNNQKQGVNFKIILPYGI